jgi:hypothetical protein
VNIEAGWTHNSYSSALLLGLSLAYSALVAVAVWLFRRRPVVTHGAPRTSLLPAVLVLIAPAPILWLAREHLPVLGALPLLPRSSFCFGDPDLNHAIALALPVVAALVAPHSISRRKAPWGSVPKRQDAERAAAPQDIAS